MLQVSLVKETKELAGLREEWDDVVSRMSSATIFDTFDWNFIWWDEIGCRSLLNRLFVITFRDEKEDLQGIAPFYIKLELIPFGNSIRFLGRGTSDYHNLIVSDGHIKVCTTGLYSFLATSRDWQFADLDGLKQDSQLLNALPEDSGLTFFDLRQEKCPFITLPRDSSDSDNWTQLLLSFSKKMRGSIRYNERALERVYRVDHRIAATKENVALGMRSLFSLHQRRWNKEFLPGAFYSAAKRKFHARLAIKLQKRGWLRLHILQLDNNIEAALYCFSFNEVTSYYQGGYEPTLSKRSLGSVLTAVAVRTACQEGSKTFDFLRGNESYKMRWTNGEYQWNFRRIITKTRYSGKSIVRFTFHLKQRLESAVKSALAVQSKAKSSVDDEKK